jgi:hypothetical protein
MHQETSPAQSATNVWHAGCSQLLAKLTWWWNFAEETMSTAGESITKRLESVGRQSAMSEFQHRAESVTPGQETWLDRLQAMIVDQPLRAALFGLGIGAILGACCFGAYRMRR